MRVYVPRSYQSTEDVIRRAIENSYNSVKQMLSRIRQLMINGHAGGAISKFEIIVKGGTWSSFPREYQFSFIRDLFYAANMLQHCSSELPRCPPDRFDELISRFPRLPHDDSSMEHAENDNSPNKIIGVTIETRPDLITKQAIQDLRLNGVTRVELGAQHTDDAVLKLLNRGCTSRHTIQAVRLLKDCGFKVDLHWMTLLPYPTPEPLDDLDTFDPSQYPVDVQWPSTKLETDANRDMDMLDGVFSSPDLSFDQLKLYDFEPVPFSTMFHWYQRGLYRPYSYEQLLEVTIHAMQKVPPWVRVKSNPT